MIRKVTRNPPDEIPKPCRTRVLRGCKNLSNYYRAFQTPAIQATSMPHPTRKLTPELVYIFGPTSPSKITDMSNLSEANASAPESTGAMWGLRQMFSTAMTLEKPSFGPRWVGRSCRTQVMSFRVHILSSTLFFLFWRLDEHNWNTKHKNTISRAFLSLVVSLLSSVFHHLEGGPNWCAHSALHWQASTRHQPWSAKQQ